MSAVTSPLSSQMTDPLQRRFRGSAKIGDYEVMNEKLGEGTFGVVSKAVSKRNGKVVALKKILMHHEKEGFPITALREVKLLKMLSHPNILRLEEMAIERQTAEERLKDGKKRAVLYMVMPYMDHDLSGMLTNQDINFTMPQIKCYMLQLLEGVRYLHDSMILHRDMKAANILISNKGILQIADFGLARHYDGQPPQPGRGCGEATRDYTSLVVTRWYRPPELLLTLKRYTPAIDMWGVGCIFGEMFERKPILEGKTDVDQCVKIFKLVGSPNDSNMPGWSDLPGCEGTRTWEHSTGDIEKRFGPRVGREGLDMLKSLLQLDWRKRINAYDALHHDFFRIQPLPARAEDLPRYEDSHELDSRRRGHEKQRALPPAPAGGTVGMGPDEQWNPNGPPYHTGYGNDRRGYSRDRGPPMRYDDRRSRPPVVEGGRQPSWKAERDGRGPPSTNGHALPPRPDLIVRPDVAPGRPDMAPRGHSGRSQGPAPGDSRDSYKPSYSDRSRDHDRGERPRRNSREPGHRDPDRAYRDRDMDGGAPERVRDRDRDRDRSYRDTDASYRDRDRGGHRDSRTRSRSPDRREGEGARRERLQNREWDFYGDSYRR